MCASWYSRHVDRDQVPLAAVERVGQGQGGLGLADAAGADEQEDADRPARVGRGSARAVADPLGDRLQGVRLADDALLELARQVEHGLDLVARPSCRPGCRSSRRRPRRPSARRRRPASAASRPGACAARRLASSSACSAAARRRLAALAVAAAVAGSSAWRPRSCRASVADLVDQLLLVLPARLELGQRGPRLRRARVVDLGDPLVVRRRRWRARARGCRSRPRGASICAAAVLDRRRAWRSGRSRRGRRRCRAG